MTLDDVLQDLIQHLEINRNITITFEQVRQWPKDAVFIFQQAGWIKTKAPAKTVVCPGCEESCFMPVHSYPAKANQPERNFVGCDMKDDMGRIPIPPEMLQQWQITEYQVAQWLARELDLRGKPKKDKKTQTIQIGDLQGKKQSGKLELGGTEPISLKTSGHSLPLIEAVYFQGNTLQVDTKAIIKIVDRPPPSEIKDGYQPTNARREIRKEDTQDMYKSWRKAYGDFKRKRQNMSDTWYSQQIEKMKIAQGRKAETIRRRLKK
jgi:hypothetical protein